MISIESHGGWGGRTRVWVHVRNQRFPLVNWTDLEEGMAMTDLNQDCSSSSSEETQSGCKN